MQKGHPDRQKGAPKRENGMATQSGGEHQKQTGGKKQRPQFKKEATEEGPHLRDVDSPRRRHHNRVSYEPCQRRGDVRVGGIRGDLTAHKTCGDVVVSCIRHTGVELLHGRSGAGVPSGPDLGVDRGGLQGAGGGGVALGDGVPQLAHGRIFVRRGDLREKRHIKDQQGSKGGGCLV